MRRLTTLALLLVATLYAEDRVPVIVELFTSEGCSSCPPADALLADLSRQQPVANVDVIVLSEHVDYWNSAGWKDPFSTSGFSARQQLYATLMNSKDIYTPEAVVDGRYATVGSNRRNVIQAISSSGAKPKPDLEVGLIREGNMLTVRTPIPTDGVVWLALVQAKAISHVGSGENGGRTLQHVNVVRLLKRASRETRLLIDPRWNSDLRVVAFVQDMHSGRILQAAEKAL